jgi:ribosomal protein S18 acetylase RimI-like enzyme
MLCETSAELVVQPLIPADFDAAFQIFHGVFPAKYTIEFLDAWELRKRVLSLGAFTKQGRLLGFAVVCPKEEGRYQIEFLGVDPNCQKGGIGTLLLRRIQGPCVQEKFRLTLIPVNDERIIQWYKHNGFRDCGAPVRSAYTGDLEQLMEYRGVTAG